MNSTNSSRSAAIWVNTATTVAGVQCGSANAHPGHARTKGCTSCCRCGWIQAAAHCRSAHRPL
eukprot:5228071-Prymnesium_polylepis.1